MTGTQALIRSGVTALPVDVSYIAAYFGIKLVDYTTFSSFHGIPREELCRISPGGFSLVEEGVFVCVLNGSLCHSARRKWTAAHELGHVLSGHISGEPFHLTERQEQEADRFAAELLAPLTVLHFCGVSSALEIKRLCGISEEAAEYRFRELLSLRRRQEDIFRSGLRTNPLTPDEIPEYTLPQSVFLQRECDRELFMQFSPFIGSYIAKRATHDGYGKYLSQISREPMAI